MNSHDSRRAVLRRPEDRLRAGTWTARAGQSRGAVTALWWPATELVRCAYFAATETRVDAAAVSGAYLPHRIGSLRAARASRGTLGGFWPRCLGMGYGWNRGAANDGLVRFVGESTIRRGCNWLGGLARGEGVRPIVPQNRRRGMYRDGSRPRRLGRGPGGWHEIVSGLRSLPHRARVRVRVRGDPGDLA